MKGGIFRTLNMKEKTNSNANSMNNNLIMRESIIGSYLMDKANNMKESS